MHLGAFSAGNQIFAAGEPLCWCQGRQALECWALGCRVWGRLAGPSAGLCAALGAWLLVAGSGCGLGVWLGGLCGLAPGEALGGCPSAGLAGRVGHRQGSRWKGGLRCAGSHFRLLLLVSGAHSLPERTCNRIWACKDASACVMPLVSWSSWGVLREASLTVSSAGASFQAGSSAVDSATIVAGLVNHLTGSAYAVGAASAVLRLGWLLPQLLVGF